MRMTQAQKSRTLRNFDGGPSVKDLNSSRKFAEDFSQNYRVPGGRCAKGSE